MDVAPSKNSGSSYVGANVQINPPVGPWADIWPCLMKSASVDDDVWETSLEDQVDPITSLTAKNIVERSRTEIQRRRVPGTPSVEEDLCSLGGSHQTYWSRQESARPLGASSDPTTRPES